MTPAAVGLRLATRGSRLARAQAELAITALAEASVLDSSIIVVETTGDQRPDVPAAEMPGQGWFTAEIENAVLDGRADCAVHSAKDLPSKLAPGLVIAAYLARADCRDAFISHDGIGLADLPEGSRVATSSPRRAAMIRELNPGVEVVPMRGNVDTRLAKLDHGDVDALLLACAGLDRLGLGERITTRLDPTVFVPAPAQGAIALQTRSDNGVAEVVAGADHSATRAALVAERTLLVALGGGCLLPLGAWARAEGTDLVISAAMPGPDGMRRIEMSGPLDQPEALGELAAWRLR